MHQVPDARLSKYIKTHYTATRPFITVQELTTASFIPKETALSSEPNSLKMSKCEVKLHIGLHRVFVFLPERRPHSWLLFLNTGFGNLIFGGKKIIKNYLGALSIFLLLIFSRAVWKWEGGAGTLGRTTGAAVSENTSLSGQGKKLLDPVGIFTSNLMHGSIFDTNYAATQTDLSKLQGKEDKRRLILQNQSCQLQGNL